MALHSLYNNCADMPLRNCSLAQELFYTEGLFTALRFISV